MEKYLINSSHHFQPASFCNNLHSQCVCSPEFRTAQGSPFPMNNGLSKALRHPQRAAIFSSRSLISQIRHQWHILAKRASAFALLLTQLQMDENIGLANYLTREPGKGIQLPHGNFSPLAVVPSATFEVAGVYFFPFFLPEGQRQRISTKMIQIRTAAGTWKSLSWLRAHVRCWRDNDIHMTKTM